MDTKEIKKRLGNRERRINSGKLYKIKDKEANIIPFKPNVHQQKLHDEQHNRNVILKARQLGFSTDIEIQALDYALFNSNVNVWVIAQTLDLAKDIFQSKIKLARDHLPQWLKHMYEVNTDRANELRFKRKGSKSVSQIKVGTSFRSGTINFLHISEFGKICSKKPDTAKEIVTGSLQAVPTNGIVFIESTAEWQTGKFYDMVHQAKKNEEMGKKLSKLDYKFHFFPRWKQDEYQIPEWQWDIDITSEFDNYFKELDEEHNIQLTDAQKRWYIQKENTIREDIYREFPSYREEAFKSAIEWAYYEKDLSLARKQGRISKVNHKSNYPVYVAWDIGWAGGWDDTALWFFQVIGKEYRFLEYWSGTNYSMEDICTEILDEKPYNIEKVFLPHDAKQTEQTIWKKRVDFIRQLGYKSYVLNRWTLADQINLVRSNFEDCYFDENNCEEWLTALWAYRRKYDEKNDVFRKKPLHNWASHGADAFRYAIRGIKVVEASKKNKNKKKVYTSDYSRFLY